jgi:Nif-specific regulatory protein
MPLPLQAKLLRVLDDKTFKRVGGLQDVRVDVRLVAATHRDLPLGINRDQVRYRMRKYHVGSSRRRRDRCPPPVDRMADRAPACA